MLSFADIGLYSGSEHSLYCIVHNLRSCVQKALESPVLYAQMNDSASKSPTDYAQVLIDLISCFVASNGVGLEKGYGIAKALHEGAVITIDTKSNLIRCEERNICSWLSSSSYPRGEYVAALVANRIKRSSEQINSQNALKFLESLHLLSEFETRSVLSPLFGIGEKFIDNYLIISART